MRILDSSFCADFLRGRPSAKEYRLAHPDESFVLTSIGYYELYHGAVKEGRDPVLIGNDLPWIERLDYTRAHVLEGARIRQELEEKGPRIQHPDMMLAGVARSFDAPLVTADTGFDRIDDLDVDNHQEIF